MPTRFITNVSCRMSQDFLKIAATLLGEANDGTFLTKRQAIDRRDKLVDIDYRANMHFLEQSPMLMPNGTVATAEHGAPR